MNRRTSRSRSPDMGKNTSSYFKPLEANISFSNLPPLSFPETKYNTTSTIPYVE